MMINVKTDIKSGEKIISAKYHNLQTIMAHSVIENVLLCSYAFNQKHFNK